MIKQRDIFLTSEGDAFFERNHLAEEKEKLDPVLNCIDELKLKPKHVLEIGCSDGWRLHAIKERINCDVKGIDPSAIAKDDGISKGLDIRQGTADDLPFEDNSFDLVIFGFCLYLCDRSDLFKICSEADRVLENNGMLLVFDFITSTPCRNDYHHKKGISSYKMDYTEMFLWNPSYSMKYQKIMAYDDGRDASKVSESDRIAISILSKDDDSGYSDCDRK
jgi:ubiquinone/menaquinone biosynthesis C-methylase UbiE